MLWQGSEDPPHFLSRSPPNYGSPGLSPPNNRNPTKSVTPMESEGTQSCGLEHCLILYYFGSTVGGSSIIVGNVTFSNDGDRLCLSPICRCPCVCVNFLLVFSIKQVQIRGGCCPYSSLFVLATGLHDWLRALDPSFIGDDLSCRIWPGAGVE